MTKLDKVINGFENTLSVWDGVRDEPEGSVELTLSLTLCRELHQNLVDFRATHIITEMETATNE